MKAIGKYIVIRTVDEKVQSSSGVLLSADDTSRMRYKKALVIASGTDVVGIQEGDEIYYDKSNSFTMMVDGEQVTVILERDVVLVV